MTRPRFSIVIPTRDRAHTLEYAIRTCLAQTFDDFEVVVCDNCSSPATRDAVERCCNPKVKYIRSEKPLAMSDNWDLALSHARGEYLTVIGDDDGLLLHALSAADRAIATLKVKAFRWAKLYYHWPDQAQCFPANYLRIPL